MKKLPYIEFPDWVSEVIGDGLTIEYLITDGKNGNVKSKTLTSISFEVDEEASYKAEDIVVVNTDAALNGEDKETINEAYEGFKKTIGTFDTLVTCRDYANYIYNLFDVEGVYPLVSNVQVGDRRNDINYSCNVLTYSPSTGTNLKSIPSDDVTAYDLVLYPFKPLKEVSFSNLKNSVSYNDSFKLIKDGTSLDEIKNRIENSKSISHNYKALDKGNIIAYKNYYKLTAFISTSYKITKVEQLEILTHINEALARDYNARKVDFGYKIPYQSILETIMSADERIKYVSLYEPDLTTKIYAINQADQDVETDIADDNGQLYSTYVDILIKNILGHKVSLFAYNSDFNYEYNQKNCDIIDKVESISTYTGIGSIGSQYELKANEVIQFVAPNYIDKVTYPYGVEYYLDLNSGDYIPKDSLYTLTSNDTLIFKYTKSDGTEQHDQLVAGDLIRPNFDMYTSNYQKQQLHKTETSKEGTQLYYTIQTNQKVVKVQENKEHKDDEIAAYWYIANSTDHTIPWTSIGSGESGDPILGWEYTLKTDDYFFYTDQNYSNIYSFGSGTKLFITDDLYNVIRNTSVEAMTLEQLSELIEDGLYQLKNYFVTLPLDDSKYLDIIEQQIVTLTEGDTIYNSGSSITISDNDFNPLSDTAVSNIEYVLKGETSRNKLPAITSASNWNAGAFLDIYSGNGVSQTLVGNQSCEITYHLVNNLTTTASKTITGKTLTFDSIIQKTGGENIKLSEEDALTGTTIYPKVYIYEEDANVFTQEITETFDNKYVITLKSNISSCYIDLPIDTTTLRTSNFINKPVAKIMMFYVSGMKAGDSISLTAKDTITDTSRDIKLFATGTNISNITKDGFYILEFPTEYISDQPVTPNKLTLTPTYASSASNFTTTIDTIKMITGINPYLLDDKYYITTEGNELDDLITKMRTDFSDQMAEFYVNADSDNLKEIELSNDYRLTHPLKLYDTNNVVNK